MTLSADRQETRLGETRLLEVRGISKRFGGERALDDVDFDLRAGEIHALVGQNGAGKSTLVKILAGVIHRDAGIVAIDGKELAVRFTPVDVKAAGLAFVHQDLGLSDQMSVSENVALACGYVRSRGLISFSATERHVKKLLDELNLAVSPRALVGELSQDEKVLVAVARAFALNGRIIVLDEVSSSLSAPDVARLTDGLRAAKGAGIGYIYVTHRLEEVFSVADRVTVLRDGRNVETSRVSELDYDRLVMSIVGSEVPVAAAQGLSRPNPNEDVALRVRELTGPGLAAPLSFGVARGEIVALCGLVGCGAHEVASLLGGAAQPVSGVVELDAGALPLGSPPRLRGAGCTYVPADRQRDGGAFSLSIRENLFLCRPSSGPPESFVRWPKREREDAEGLERRFDIRPPGNVDRPLQTLSGGNQQKVICARALRSRPRLLVIDDPTAGVDVGSRGQIHAILRQSAADGTIVVFASTDFDEVASEATRALVMRNGHIQAELSGDDLTAEALAQASYGFSNA